MLNIYTMVFLNIINIGHSDSNNLTSGYIITIITKNNIVIEHCDHTFFPFHTKIYKFIMILFI